MRIQRAVILAAGSGTRLGSLTANRPKSLLAVDGRPLIERQLATLRSGGVAQVAVVVGYQEQRLRMHLGSRVTYVRNERYRDTNSLYSLWLAIEHLRGGAFVLNGDVVFNPLLLERLKWHPAPDALLYDRSRRPKREELKVRVAGPYVVDVGTHMPAEAATGQSVGLMKFGDEGVCRLAEVLGRLVTAGHVKARAARAVAALAQRWPVAGIDADGLGWADVDYPEDLVEARRIVSPAEDLPSAMDVASPPAAARRQQG